MTIRIEDGKGSGKTAQVNAQNRLVVQAVIEGEGVNAVESGNAFNLNTGLITFSADGTLAYLKNNDEKDYVLKAIALGSFEGITHSDDPYITLVRNPTGGDLISDAADMDIISNRNFGSSNTLSANVYKGKSGGTISGGETLAILQATPGGRSFYTIDFLIPRGSSVGVSLTANVSSGSAKWYCAFIGYLKEDES